MRSPGQDIIRHLTALCMPASRTYNTVKAQQYLCSAPEKVGAVSPNQSSVVTASLEVSSIQNLPCAWMFVGGPGMRGERELKHLTRALQNFLNAENDVRVPACIPLLLLDVESNTGILKQPSCSHTQALSVTAAPTDNNFIERSLQVLTVDSST